MLLARLEVVGEIDARGAVRFDVRNLAILRIADRPHHVLVENFSRTGFLFVSRAAFPVGTLVAVGLGSVGAREARILWSDGERHGCEFLVPLPQSMFDRAFRGQEHMVAAIEEAFRLRYGEPAQAASAVAPRPPPEAPASPVRSRLSRLWHRLRRRRDPA